MKTICFYCADQNPERDKSRGITNYTFGLLENLQKTGRISLSAVVSKSSFGAPDAIHRFRLPFRTDHIPGRLLADHLHPLIASKVGADIWHYPKGFLPFGSQVRATKVGTIADVILQFYADKYPQERSGLAYRYWISMLKNAIQHIDLVLTVSEYSQNAIIEFCQRYRLKPPPIVVTYQGVEDLAGDIADPVQRDDYVLHLASKLPHKKTRWLLKQWRDFQHKGVSLPPLRLIGQLDSVSSGLAASLGNIEVLKPQSRQELANTMKHARALLLPSEIEGFGLPAVEAYLSGTPVAYVQGTAVEEILGQSTPGGFKLEPDSFCRALEEVLSLDPADIQQKCVELRGRFSWDRCVERTLAAYNKVAS